ncbi:MAG: GDSL-type esterase/lipase family protein [Polyangiaceae bacterium]|jgi:lysophospholipase L1-like esterase
MPNGCTSLTPDTTTRAKCEANTGTGGGIACHFGGDAGNYDVSFVLGGATAGNTEVQAETSREMLAATATAAAQTLPFSMTVNVRQPQGQPDWSTASNGTPGLDMYFLGQTAELQSIAYAPATNDIVMYMTGDSTVCDQDGPGITGWGQRLPQYFQCGISLANYANSGAMTECSPATTPCPSDLYLSFYDDPKMWPAVKALLKPNDYVMIEFGHNDKQTPQAQFELYLNKYISESQAAGAIPFLVTPIARAEFTGNTVTVPQHVNDVGVNLPQTIIAVGAAANVPVIDLTSLTVAWLNSVGPSAKTAYYADQVTHLNVAGAQIVSGLVKTAIQSLGISPLENYLR